MSRMTTCPTCGTYGYIPPSPVTLAPKPRTPTRNVRTGETFDLAPHEVVQLVRVVRGHEILLMTLDGGPGGMRGVRVG